MIDPCQLCHAVKNDTQVYYWIPEKTSYKWTTKHITYIKQGDYYHKLTLNTIAY